MEDTEVTRRKLTSKSSTIDHHRNKTYDPTLDYLMADFLIKNEYKDIWYAGVIPDVPVEVDVTNRTNVLRIIDRGKKEELIPLQLTKDDDAIFSLSRDDIKISKQDPEADMLMQVPIHEIAAVCYIKDDGLHTLAIKYGNPDKCDLAVLYCKSQIQADSICASLGQCFQLAYQDATVQIIVKAIEKASMPNDYDTSPSDSDTTDYHPDSHSLPKEHRTPSESSSTHHALLKEYMNELSRISTFDELTQFSKLFKELNDPLKTDIADICDELYKLFGSDRKHLITGMCPFIPSKHYQYFERYLKDKGLDITESGHSTLSSRHSYDRIYTRSLSDVSMVNASDSSTMNSSDLNHVLERLSIELEQMDASVGVVNNPYIYSNSNEPD